MGLCVISNKARRLPILRVPRAYLGPTAVTSNNFPAMPVRKLLRALGVKGDQSQSCEAPATNFMVTASR